MESLTVAQKLLLSFICCHLSLLLQGVSSLRCYECNPSAGYSVSGTYSSSSSYSPSGAGSGTYGSSSSDCYSPDTRQIKDCAWDIQSCYTVVLPGPQAASAVGGVYNQQQPQGQFGISQNIPYGNPYTTNSGLIVQRGCGKYPGVYEVGDEECRVVTLPGTSTRATVCNCRSDSCNSRRPDQVQNPITGQSTITTGFYPNAPPTLQQYNPNQAQYPPASNYASPGGMYGPGSPYAQPGNQYNSGGQYAYGSGYYGSAQQQPGAQYPYPSAYGPQQPPYYNSPVGQANYPGYVQPASQYPAGQYGTGVNYVSDPYAYQGRYGAAASLQRSGPLCWSTLLLLLIARCSLS